jgi:hypothetical protein
MMLGKMRLKVTLYLKGPSWAFTGLGEHQVLLIISSYSDIRTSGRIANVSHIHGR